MGIDKPDVWSTSYLGMPWTLKGLYQSFGRAARLSNWDSTEHTDWRSGVCFCALPEKGGHRRFNPELGILKTLERLYDLFYSPSTIVTENGYVLLPIYENLERPYWDPCQNAPTNQSAHPDPSDQEDSKDDYSYTSAFVDWTDAEQREKYRAQKSRSALIGQRMWVIACLQRTNGFDFQGIHRKVLYKCPDGPINLEDVLRRDGYSGVMESLKKIPHNCFIDDNSKAFAVLKVNSRVDDWSDASEFAIDGYSILRKRHETGSEELKEFIRRVESGHCIRKLFSKVIGVDKSNSKGCLDKGNRAMPCSNCKGKMGLNFTFPEMLWSDEDTTREMGWHNTKGRQANWNPSSLGELVELDIAISQEQKITMSELIKIDHRFSDISLLVKPVTLTSMKSQGSFDLLSWDSRKKIATLEVSKVGSGVSEIVVVNPQSIGNTWSGILLNPSGGFALMY
jgi:hypothetical protein